MLDLFDSTVKVQLEKQEPFVNISIAVNESGEGYSVGDFQYKITPGCLSWFEQDKCNKTKLAEYLIQVAHEILQEEKE